MPIRKRATRLLLISILTVVATLVICEIVVRVVPLYPDTFTLTGPWEGWRYQPGKTGTWVNAMCWGQIKNEVTINSRGLHDVEHSYEKPDGTRRVVVLGDSMVAAFEIPVEQAFFRRLETLLTDENPATPYEVIALGHQGYGTDLEYIYYDEEGYRYQPDLVLLVMQPHNDIEDNYPGLLGDDPKNTRFRVNDEGQLIPQYTRPTGPEVLPFPESLLTQSRLYKLLQLRINSRRAAPSVDGDALAQMRHDAWDYTFALVDAVRHRVEADGAQFGVVVEQSIIAPPEDRARVHREIGARLDALHIRYLSLLPTFDAADSAANPLRYSCDTHWTPAGHTLAAETIAPFAAQFFDVNGESEPEA